jgi:hypothetical protein
LRRALKTRGGIAALVVVLALAGIPSLLGVGRGHAGRTAATPATASPAAAAAPRPSGHAVPFTGFDLFLLVSGGLVLLLCGANVSWRPRAQQEAP